MGEEVSYSKQDLLVAERLTRIETKIDDLIKAEGSRGEKCKECENRIDAIETEIATYKTAGGVISKLGSVIWGIVGGIITTVLAAVILWFLSIR